MNKPIFRFSLNVDTGEVKKIAITEYDYIENNGWTSGIKNQPYYRYKYGGTYYYAYVPDFGRYVNRRVYLWEDDIEQAKETMAQSLLESIEDFQSKAEKYANLLKLMRGQNPYCEVKLELLEKQGCRVKEKT